MIAQDDIKPMEFTTYFKSVIVFGYARVIEDEADQMRNLRLLAKRYSDETVTAEMTDKEIARGFKHLLIIEITIKHLTAKEAVELRNANHKT